MGHRHSSAPLGGASAICAARNGIAEFAAGPRPLESLGESAEVRRPDLRLDPGVGSTDPDFSALSEPPVSGTLSRAAVWFLLGCLRFYQSVFSSLMPVGCKFHPSCSHYACEAIGRHGPQRGLRLAAWRLVRCSPFTRGGYDPVPESQDASIHEVSA